MVEIMQPGYFVGSTLTVTDGTTTVTLVDTIDIVGGTVTNSGGGTATITVTGGTPISFGSQYQIPYVNATTDNFDYSSNLTFNGADLSISGKLIANSKQAIYVPDQTNFTGSFVIGDGGTALSHTLINDGRYNTLVGIGAGTVLSTGYNNMALGYNSLHLTTTATSNVAVGRDAMNKNTSGSSNTALGASALFSNTTGGSNAAIGLQALYSSTTGNYNFALGVQSLYQLTSGSENFAAGYQAGTYITGGTTYNNTDNQSIYIGNKTKASASGNTNEVVLGYNVTGNGSNTVTIGNSSITANYFTGNILPSVSDGGALGSTSNMFSDLFLASGSVINWNSGDVTLTHSADKLTFAGAASGYVFTAASGSGIRETAARFNVSDSANDAILITNGTNTDGLFVPIIGGIYDSGSTRTPLEMRGYVTSTNDTGNAPLLVFNSLRTSSASDPSNGTFSAITTRPLFQVQNNGTVGMSMAADRSITLGNISVSPLASDGASLGTTALQWSDLFLASGAVINFNNGDLTLTHSSGAITNSGKYIAGNTVRLKGYTVATLPTGVQGDTAFITDGDTGLVWGATAINSGTGATPYQVWFNGTNWTVVGK